MIKMTFPQACESLKQVLVFFSADREAEELYASTVYYGVRWMEPDRFNEVCQELTTVMVPFKRPVTTEYIAVYEKLRRSRWEPHLAEAERAAAKEEQLKLKRQEEEMAAADKMIAGLSPEQIQAWTKTALEEADRQKVAEFVRPMWVKVELRMMAMRALKPKKAKR